MQLSPDPFRGENRDAECDAQSQTCAVSQREAKVHGRSPQAARDGGMFFSEGEDCICDRENFGQGLPPVLSSFRQLRVNFGEVHRANSRIHQHCGDLVRSRFGVEKRQHSGGIKNIFTHAMPRHAALRATRRRASDRVPDKGASTPALGGWPPAPLPASGVEAHPRLLRLPVARRAGRSCLPSGAPFERPLRFAHAPRALHERRAACGLWESYPCSHYDYKM